MPEKVNKEDASPISELSHLFQRITTMKPSNLVMTIAVLGVAIFLLGGGLYDIIVQPIPAYYDGSRFYFLFPDLSMQFLFDTVLAVVLYTLGFIGLMSIYHSARHAYNPRTAYMTLVLGVSLLAISYIFIEYFIYLKLSGG
jgi:hypothetical protein